MASSQHFLLSSAQIPYPPVYKSVVKWLGVFNLDLFSTIPLECITHTNFHTTLVLQTLVPFVVISVCSLSAIAMFKTSRAPGDFRSDLGNGLLNFVFFIIFLIYPSTASKIFSTFQCLSLDDGTRHLRADFSIDCDSDSHALVSIFAGVMILVYPIGAPALYSYLLFYKHGSELSRLRDIEMLKVKLLQEAEAEDKYNRSSTQLRTSVASTITERAKELTAEEAELKSKLPDFMQKLVTGAHSMQRHNCSPPVSSLTFHLTHRLFPARLLL